jgi:queuine tRNA-ribosyltransferase
MSRLGFVLERTASGSQARAGRFRTLHGEVLTPLFMPVGTLATVRAQRNETLADSGSQVLLANTFHLLQRPGVEVFQRFGGIHGFMRWGRSVLTDSGGYQIYSLAKHREMKEAGAWFRTFEGAKVFLSPESSIATQRAIGADIMMVLDECIDATSPREEAARAMALTHRWAARSLEARGDSPQALFGIVQGACWDDLRVESAQALRELPFDGLAVGGLAVGEPREERERVVGLTTPHLPEHLPRYLMGVGTPIDLLEAVHRGVDMFDCILPTAYAAQGMAFTSVGRLGLRRGVYRLQTGPLDPACGCPTCATHDRAYVSHLIKAREYLGWSLVGQHNLYFYHSLMRDLRQAILEDRFEELYRARREILAADDQENPVKRPRPAKAAVDAPPPTRGDYRIRRSPLGHASIQQISSGETMHSVSEPILEARRLYVEQARLRERLLTEAGDPGELVVWDVGLGAGTNAMAVLQAAEQLAAEVAQSDIARLRGIAVRPLRLVSFERDLDSFHLACSEPEQFAYLKHPAPHVVARGRRWASADGRIVWELREGDFLTQLREAPPAPPDLVMYDPFSAKADGALWSVEAFEQLKSCTGPAPAVLFTYSNSTLVRAHLLAAGWFVGRGVATGPKEETTLASSAPVAGLPYLGLEFLERWSRSHLHTAALDARVLAHPQFGGAGSMQALG